jgi:hypothetical protein
MRKLMVIMAMALVLCGAMAMSAQAQVYDFNIAHPQDTPGLVSYAGGATPLVGTNLVVDSVDVFGSTGALPDGTYTIDGGLLNFTTGNFNNAGAFTYVFDAGGSVTLVGTLGADAPVGVGTPIGMFGNFSAAAVVSQNTDPDTTHVGTFNFTDEKNPEFAALIGLTNPLIGDIFLGFVTDSVSPGDPFDSTRVNGFRVHNTVPVPPAVWLFGSGLLGLIGLRRKLKA